MPIGARGLARGLFTAARRGVGRKGRAAFRESQSLLTGARPEEILANPQVMLPLAGAGVGFGVTAVGAPLVGGFAESVGLGQREEKFSDFMQDQRVQRMLRQAEIDRLRTAMLQSAARLAAVDPQLYNQVLAGRRLPQGAVVFGGQPRVDLLEQLAYDMASGAYNETDAQDELSSLLGA